MKIRVKSMALLAMLCSLGRRPVSAFLPAVSRRPLTAVAAKGTLFLWNNLNETWTNTFDHRRRR